MSGGGRFGEVLNPTVSQTQHAKIRRSSITPSVEGGDEIRRTAVHQNLPRLQERWRGCEELRWRRQNLKPSTYFHHLQWACCGVDLQGSSHAHVPPDLQTAAWACSSVPCGPVRCRPQGMAVVKNEVWKRILIREMKNIRKEERM